MSILDKLLGSPEQGSSAPGDLLYSLIQMNQAAASRAAAGTRGGAGGLRLPGQAGGDLEIIYGGNVFNPSSADASHPTHLHFAMEQGPIKKVLRRINRLPGFDVGEHPAFGGVDPVHTQGSHHYSGRAGDINYRGGGRFQNEAAALDWLERMLARRYGAS